MDKEVYVQPHDVHKSINESFKQVKLMREGKMKKNSLEDLFKNIEKWKSES